VTGVVTVLVAVGLVLGVATVLTWWEDRDHRLPSRHDEPPSRLDRLDGINPPARSSPPSPPGKSERAGATYDEWSI
jgi:hypothetical protein